MPKPHDHPPTTTDQSDIQRGPGTAAAPDIDLGLATLTQTLGGIGLQPSAIELAEVLWLARYITPSSRVGERNRANEHKEGVTDTQNQTYTKPAAPPGTEETPEPREETPSPGARAFAAVRAPGGNGVRGLPLRAPSARMLSNTLDLSRALRPLHRRAASRTQQCIDEEATVEAVAAQRLAGNGPWSPVLRPATEPWLDLALVVDRGASMALWPPLIAEFERLLTYNGAFRRLRLYALDTNAETARLLLGANLDQGRPLRPQALQRPDGRCLTLVVSDCISPAWHSGSMNDLLALWSRSSPLALVQMLPRRMWSGTALGRGSQIDLRTNGPGLPSARLLDLTPNPAQFATTRSTPAMTAGRAALHYPVLPMEPGPLLAWARLVAGDTHILVPGIRFAAGTVYAPATGESPPASEPASMDDLLDHFFGNASPKAQHLAGLLAAVPLYLPVMRLVQQVMLPSSTTTHLAEVFISGLLHRDSGLDSQEGHPCYRFPEQVRARLLDLIGRSESLRVLTEVSRFVTDHVGGGLDFQALIQDPGGGSGPYIDPNDPRTRHFATIGAAVLGRLGGSFAELGRKLARVGNEKWGKMEVAPDARDPIQTPPRRLYQQIRREVSRILMRLNGHLLETELKKGLDAWYRNEDATRITLPTNANDAERLMGLDLFNQIELIRAACEGYFERAEKDVEARDRGWCAAKDLVGWLVLLAVRDDWSREAIATNGGREHFTVKLPLMLHHAQAVAFAAVREIKAVLKTPATREQPGGAFDLGSLEIGWDKNAIANFVKQSILKQIAPNRRVPMIFESADNDYLDTRLQSWIAQGIASYLPIDLGRAGDALTDPQVRAILRADIPHLNILEISRGDWREVLLLPEARLSTIIDDFLELERHLSTDP